MSRIKQNNIIPDQSIAIKVDLVNETLISVRLQYNLAITKLYYLNYSRENTEASSDKSCIYMHQMQLQFVKYNIYLKHI